MIRLTYLLRRKAGLSRADFQQTWLEEHGPLVASQAQHLNILRYVQVHTIDDSEGSASARRADPRGEMEPAYDGVAELWWRNRTELAQALATPQGQAASEALLADERRFIDLAASPLWLAHEYPQINPAPEQIVASPMSPLVKLHYPLRHLPSMSLEDAQLYWRTNHGPIIRQNHGRSGLVLRYIQVHRFEDALESQLREARKTQADTYTGHAELWFDTRLLAPTAESLLAAQRAFEDETHFIDFRRSVAFYAKEHVLIDRRP